MKVTSITALKTLSDTTTVMDVAFDDGSSALMLYDYAEAMKFIDKDVIVSFRNDLYDGIIRRFVNTLTEMVKVNTIDKEHNIKLFTNVDDGHSNVVFADIDIGDTSLNAIVYCTDMEFQTSARAVWCDLTVTDSMRRIAHVRLFDPDQNVSQFKGKYIRCDLRKTKFGFNTNYIESVDNMFPLNPEVDIAERYVMDVFADDPEMLKIISDSDLFTYLKQHVEYEPGYLLVRLAVELSLAAEMKDLLKEANVSTIMRALLCNKLWIKNADSVYSKALCNFVNTSRYKFEHSKDVLLLLDECNDIVSVEKELYETIQTLADKIIKAKKGLIV